MEITLELCCRGTVETGKYLEEDMGLDDILLISSNQQRRMLIFVWISDIRGPLHADGDALVRWTNLMMQDGAGGKS